ncbi:MAG TPA: hypothetical protein ENJ23_05040 [Bacteroidetes bacterium]|nr:hypothetical protein [Bacteroidota bacterium]
MEFLQSRVNELMQDVRPLCQIHSDEIFWDRYIVTIKSSEVVAWSLDCLLCPHSDCPFAPTCSAPSLSEKKIKKSA